MRIIPDDAPARRMERQDVGSMMYCLDSGIEITDKEWDEIGLDWRIYSRRLATTYKPFAQYLKELLSLKEGK